MRRRLSIVALVVAVVVALFAAIRIIDSTTDNRRREAASTATNPEPEFEGLEAVVTDDGVCEVLVDLGVVSYSSTVVKSVRIKNAGTTPLVLVDYTTQCRCMWLELDREPITVGESRDVELYFDSRGEWGSVGNYMEITTSRDNAPVVLWIGAEVE